MPKPAAKPTIAVDIDDVLAANAEGFVEFSNQRWGTNLTPDDYDEHWAKVWKIDEEEAERRAHIFIGSGAPKKYRRLEKAEEVLRKLHKNYKLVIVTSRRKAYSANTQDWLDQYVPGLFDEVHYVGIWDEVTDGRINATKAEYAQKVGADYLIDDQPKHCVAAAEVGITGLLFGEYPWTKVDKLPKNVVPVKDWQAVLEYFDAQSRRAV